MTNERGGSRDHHRIAKLAFGGTAIISVLIGLLIYVFAEHVGLEPDMAQWVALVFLGVGVADYLLLWFWDRIFRSG
ncbi:MAG: hypothetical protein ACR2PO_15295 [Methyloligellaceae bacterium]